MNTQISQTAGSNSLGGRVTGTAKNIQMLQSESSTQFMYGPPIYRPVYLTCNSPDKGIILADRSGSFMLLSKGNIGR